MTKEASKTAEGSRYGKQIKAARIAAGYETPADAARALGVPYQSIVAHENGHSASGRTPKMRALKAYAKGYGTTVEALTGGVAETSSASRAKKAAPMSFDNADDRVSFTADEVDAMLDVLMDVTEVIDAYGPQQPGLLDKLSGLTSARKRLGLVIDEIYLRQHPTWTPDLVDDGLSAAA